MTKKKDPNNLSSTAISIAEIEAHIFIIRGQKVMLDEHLAVAYGVTTKRLNEQVKRNIARFPSDFIFQLTQEELQTIRSQNATASKRNIRFLPYAFTEHGAVMVATILNSPIAVAASIQVVRAFVRMRSIIATHQELAEKLAALESKHDNLNQKTETQYKSLLEIIKKIIKQLPTQPLATVKEEIKKRPIGFVENEKNSEDS